VPERAPQVVLYTREGCRLCDHARDALRRLGRDARFDLRVLDVDADPALLDRYGEAVPVVTVDRRSGRPEGPVDLTTRGFVVDERTRPILDEVPALVGEVIASASAAERHDRGLIRERVRIELQRLFRRRAGRRPMVLPVIMER